MADACLDDLDAAELCVQENAETCGCWEQPFRTAFPAALQAAFEEISKSAEAADGSSFCQDADKSMCA